MVNAYVSFSDDDVDRIVRAKCRDDFSYFGKYYKFETARLHWDWYLSCLLFSDADPRQTPAMPLDFVDLLLLAMLYEAQITVSQLEEATVCVRPGEDAECKRRAHVIHHGGWWAPLVGTLDPKDEVGCFRHLPDALVSLGEISGALTLVEKRSAVIREFDPSLGAYVACIDQVEIPVERNQIATVLYHENIEPDLLHRETEYGGALQGIAYDSIEWLVLHRLVRSKAKRRVEGLGAGVADGEEGDVTLARWRGRREYEEVPDAPKPAAEDPVAQGIQRLPPQQPAQPPAGGDLGRPELSPCSARPTLAPAGLNPPAQAVGRKSERDPWATGPDPWMQGRMRSRPEERAAARAPQPVQQDVMQGEPQSSGSGSSGSGSSRS